jgi:hypothetical protein
MNNSWEGVGGKASSSLSILTRAYFVVLVRYNISVDCDAWSLDCTDKPTVNY